MPAFASDMSANHNNGSLSVDYDTKYHVHSRLVCRVPDCDRNHPETGRPVGDDQDNTAETLQPVIWRTQRHDHPSSLNLNPKP